MSLLLGHPTDEEFATFVPMTFEAMGRRSEFVNAVWPGGFTKEGQEMSTSRFLFLKSIDPSCRWIKVTDSEANEIIGVAQWNVYEEQKPQEVIVDGPPGTWKNEDEKEYAQELFKSYMQKRWAFIRENELPLICLNIMTVAPEHQHRGVGSMMLQWGNKLAESIGAACIVESTVEGHRLYEKSGYELKEHWTLDVPERFGDRPKQSLFFMIRPRKSGQSLRAYSGA